MLPFYTKANSKRLVGSEGNPSVPNKTSNKNNKMRTFVIPCVVFLTVLAVYITEPRIEDSKRQKRGEQKDFVIRIINGAEEAIPKEISNYYEFVEQLKKDGSITAEQADKAHRAVLTAKIP
jgi:hypothetical protein